MSIQRKIFISYRRVDNPDFTDRIRDWFIIRYGRENVFMDFDSIPPGVRFADHIRASMQQSDAVIAVIGVKWLKLLQEKASKFEDDFVRIELGLALELGKPITPICINGAPVPARGSLPPDLRPLLDYNIAFLDRTNFYDKIEPIIAAVEAELDAAQPKDQLAASPLNADDYFNRADQKEIAGDHDGAIADYGEAIRLNPHSALPYNSRGNALYEKNDHEGALADYNEAIRLDPQFADPYNGRGNVRYEKGDYDGATADYNEAMCLKPHFADPYNGRGNVLYEKGDYDSATADYNEAIRLNPEFADPYNGRGNVLYQKGDQAGAILEYNEAIRLNPAFTDPYLYRGLSREANDRKGALEDYQKFLDLGGGKRDGNQAWVEQRIGDLQKPLKT